MQLVITRIEAVSANAKMLFLEEVNRRPISYEAGQFFTFIINHYRREVRRAYSIASAPGIEDQMGVVIKRLANGEISRFLLEHLKAGDILRALPPGGRFTLQKDAAGRRTVFFIAAGSGISPVFSLLKSLLFREEFSRAVLIYQNHDEDNVIFEQELDRLQHRFAERFTLITLLSNPSERSHRPRRLNNNLLEELISANVRMHMPNDFYICGPGGFMRMAQFVIKLMGFSEENIHKENFEIGPVPPAPVTADRSPKNIQLTWQETKYEFTTAYPVNILQAALNNHIPLPYSCRGGRCSSCVVKCISGKVKMSINEVLTEKDLQNGLILTCVAYAETNLELEL